MLGLNFGSRKQRSFSRLEQQGSIQFSLTRTSSAAESVLMMIKMNSASEFTFAVHLVGAKNKF